MRKIVSIVSKPAAKWIHSLPCPLLFELTSGQWGRSTENRTSALSEFQQHPFSHIVPDSLRTVLFDRVPIFSEPGPMNDHCPLPNFLAYKDTSRAFARHSCSLSLVPQEMSLNVDMNRILPVKISGVSPNLNSKLSTSSLSCNVLNPGKYSTRIPLAHRRFCQSFCNFEKV